VGLILMLTVSALLNRSWLLRNGGRKGAGLQDRSGTKCLELGLLERVGNKL